MAALFYLNLFQELKKIFWKGENWHPWSGNPVDKPRVGFLNRSDCISSSFYADISYQFIANLYLGITIKKKKKSLKLPFTPEKKKKKGQVSCAIQVVFKHLLGKLLYISMMYKEITGVPAVTYLQLLIRLSWQNLLENAEILLST